MCVCVCMKCHNLVCCTVCTVGNCIDMWCVCVCVCVYDSNTYRITSKELKSKDRIKESDYNLIREVCVCDVCDVCVMRVWYVMCV